MGDTVDTLYIQGLIEDLFPDATYDENNEIIDLGYDDFSTLISNAEAIAPTDPLDAAYYWSAVMETVSPNVDELGISTLELTAQIATELEALDIPETSTYEAPTDNSDSDIIIGSSNPDSIDGGDGDDIIFGNGNGDTAEGDDGNDIIFGGSGNDVIYGGVGSDIIFGGDGNDFIIGDIGNNVDGDADQIYGGAGNDIIIGDVSDDTLDGGDGNDEIFGSAGDDELAGGAGFDQLEGGTGNDTYIFNLGDGSLNIINDNSTDFATSSDTLHFGSDIAVEDVTFSLSGSNLLITIDGTADAIYIENWTVSDAFKVESYTFENGAVATVADVNDALASGGKLDINSPPEANDDVASTLEDGTVTIDVLANDTDANNDDLTITGASIIGGIGGSIIINPDNTISFTPDADENGETTLEYTVTDGNGGTSTATVIVDIASVNDDPNANDDALTTAEDKPIIIEAADVLANDTDIDGDELSISDVSVVGAGGNAVLNADNSITFTPDADFNGDVVLEYTVTDNNGGSSTASINIEVTPMNDAPEATSNTLNITDDSGAVALNLSASDIDGDVLSVTVTDVPTSGRITLADGVTQVSMGQVLSVVELEGLLFEPTDGGDADVRFAYEVSDGSATGSGEALIHVTGTTPPPEPEPNTIEGTDGRDFLVGTRDDDVINGYDGKDILIGRSGDDVLNGGDSKDYLLGGSGDDVLNGDNGKDHLYGNRGDDILNGGKGKDYLSGGRGDDKLDGGKGNDYLRGGRGDDFLDGGAGKDKLYGGKGDDTFVFDADDKVINGGSGFDTLILQDANDVLHLDFDDHHDRGKGHGKHNNKHANKHNNKKDVDIDNIEAIDMTNGSGENEISLSLADVLDITDRSNDLFISGDEGDSVNISGMECFERGDNQEINGDVFASYSHRSVDIFVELGLQLNDVEVV
jgi:Ca2+-binding RTX toxin-like protein